MLAGLVIYLFKYLTFNWEFFLFLIFYYLILFIPTIFLHIDYFLQNYKVVFTINTLEKTIRINNQNLVSFDEIESITYFMPPVWHRKGFIRFLPFEDYHYAQISFKNGEQFVFTSLLEGRVEDALKQISDVRIVKKRRLFASTWLS